MIEQVQRVSVLSTAKFLVVEWSQRIFPIHIPLWRPQDEVLYAENGQARQ